MVTRRQKLIAAGLVLAGGVGLSWPLRRSEPLIPASAGVASPGPEASTPKLAASAAGRLLPQPPLITTLAPTATTPQERDGDPFAAPAAAAPVESSNSPVYQTVADVAAARPADLGTLEESEPAERIHVVHEGDRLDRLANRYLGDESRSLEIFDLNREVLDNPHLLPIGAELRIPPRESAPGEPVRSEPAT